MKILHILSTPRAEGTPNLVLDWLATGLHEQEVFVLNSEPADLSERLRAAAGWYGEADYFGHGKRKFTDIAAGVRRVCRERRPDLVLCWPTGFANWVCLGARLAEVKNLLVHCGNPPNRSFKGDWMSRYGLWPLTLLGAKCICCSAYVRKQYQDIPGISPDLLSTVWNCARATEVGRRADEVRLERRECGKFVAIMVATLEGHKDHTTLLHAVALIRGELPQLRLRLAGAGSMAKELQELADKLRISDIVEFLGMRRDVPELLGQADLFVFVTTTQEGLGSVLLEAMAAGLPIVASDVPACRELLCEGKYGKLVPPADPATLAAALVNATRGEVDTFDRHAARAFAESFTAKRMIRDYLEIAMPSKSQ